MRLATTDHIRNTLRFMFTVLVFGGSRLPESYFIWSDGCRPPVLYSSIRQMRLTLMFTQLDEASQVCGHEK